MLAAQSAIVSSESNRTNETYSSTSTTASSINTLEINAQTSMTNGNQTTALFDNYSSSMFGNSTSSNPVAMLDSSNKFDMLYNHSFVSSSPESFFSNMPDMESLGIRTPSPKSDLYNSNNTSSLVRDDLFKTTTTEPPFLYHHYQRKMEAHQSFYHQYQYGFDASSLHFTSANLKEANYEEHDVKQQLKESIETIQQLQYQIDLTKIEHEKSQSTIAALQASLTSKDFELKDYVYKLNAINQLCRAQAIKLNQNSAQIKLYQTFIKSKGLDLPKINSGDNYNSVVDPSAVVVHSDTALIPEAVNLMNQLEFDKSAHQLTIIDRNEKKLSLTENRLTFDLNSDANWGILVERITRDTDQQASLFLQHKLKFTSSSEQKLLIFTAVLSQAYALMTNRFGNFLVQRFFELGTPYQIQALAGEMRGRILELTCHPFGCHVVQKALEYVDEATRSDLVTELLSVRIPETIVHKHACHVWQKVFEIRWAHHTPPPIMKRLQEALEDRWAQVALDETGSLVIQNVFENLTEEDKRPVIDEVLKNATSISKGQWGNWVIQHILEHAEKSSDREAAFDFVLDEAVQLSMDQFASKVVEKALRIGGPQFITRFIQRICSTNMSNKPRMALVDIASDQYGNYVVQWLINNVSENDQKIHVCRLIKRHMVSIRGSKYGQRVALLVEKMLRNQDITTYPAK